MSYLGQTTSVPRVRRVYATTERVAPSQSLPVQPAPTLSMTDVPSWAQPGAPFSSLTPGGTPKVQPISERPTSFISWPLLIGAVGAAALLLFWK